jgi:2-dehydro-3-deoxyglucarate aldolase/4-hydroxy-2-oxoheptanedioate aldolase
MLNNAEEARDIIRYMKYVPEGERGVALGIAHDDYRTGSVQASLAAGNEKTCLVALIETAEAIENIDEIATVNGVDCLWIGHFDLSCSLSIPGQFDHPEFQKAVDRVVEAATRHGKALGRLVPSVGEGVALFEKGFRMIVYSSDVRLLQQALADGIDGLRARCRTTAA